MKAKELRNLSDLELAQKFEENYKKLLKLRSEVKVGRLENPNQIRETKKEIARIRTILKEREIK